MLHSNEDTIRLFKFIVTELGFNMCWSCQSPEKAINLCNSDRPDLLLIQLDLESCNTSSLIQQIMSSTPTTVIVISNSIKQNPGEIFDAMSAGALDAFTEPSTDNPDHLNDLKNKISNIKKLHDSELKIRNVKSTSCVKTTPLVAIGASTGGPAALLTILRQLPKDNSAVWVIIQHMDHQFSQGMATWLNDQIDIKVETALDNQAPKLGHVYLASTNDHLIINKRGRFEYTNIPVDYPYRPSVDVFFESALTHWPHKLIGVLLTGMGRDGANGLLSFYNRGMLTIAQNKTSCAVYGMPKAACELNAVSVQLDINQIADEIIKNLG